MTNKEIIDVIVKFGMVDTDDDIKTDFTNIVETMLFVEKLIHFNDTATLEKLLTCILFEKK